ncbi:MAG: hypothetical protein IJR06_03585 [Paludibacteraceae bacterium]|nr:hypothetical protein [Paludibacteraceae bacterium]
MKKLTNILKNLITDRIIAVTSLVALMLFTSSSAWATYYLIYNNQGDGNCISSNYFRVFGAGSSYSTTWTWNGISLRSGNNYFYFSDHNETTSSYFLDYGNGKNPTFDLEGASLQSAEKMDCDGKHGILLKTYNACTITLTFIEGTHNVEFIENCSDTPPSVSNGTISVSGTTATIVGSNVTSAGTNSDCTAATVTSRGVHFTTNQSAYPMPTYSPSVTTGTGEYNTEISGLTLTAGTYYYRSFATNDYGTRTTDWSEYTFEPAQLPPAVRIGKKLTEETAEGATQGNVRVSAYIAATGCANVNKVKIFYANNSSFRNGEGYKSASVEKTLASAVTVNNQCAEDLYLTADQVSSVVGKGETLYVRVKAINEDDVSSPYSDVAKLTYQYNKFIASNQTIADATACAGHHEFKWTGEGGMFNPAPDGFEVRYDNAEGKVASSEFSLVGDYMVWTGVTAYDDNEDASPVEHVYYFTADKEGYDNVSATATFNLSAQKLDDVTVTINEGDVDVTDATLGVEPWELIELTATRSDEGTGIEWTAPEDISLTVSNNGANASVKGKKASESVYQVSARALNSTCGRSAVSVVNIKVDGIQETCTNSN